jgi:hypothetical protein
MSSFASLIKTYEMMKACLFGTEININAKLRAEEKELTERKEGLKRASFQQKLRWANIRAEWFGIKEAPKKLAY